MHPQVVEMFVRQIHADRLRDAEAARRAAASRGARRPIRQVVGNWLVVAGVRLGQHGSRLAPPLPDRIQITADAGCDPCAV